MSITVYSKPQCVQCTATKRALDKRGLTYAEVDLSQDPQAFQYVKSLGFVQAPVVVTDQDAWSGFRPDKVKALPLATQVSVSA